MYFVKIKYNYKNLDKHFLFYFILNFFLFIILFL